MRKFTNALTVLVLLLGLLAGASPAKAAALSISGHVYDSVTMAPLQDVCVTLGPPIRCWGAFGSNPGLHTDATGFFFIDLDALSASPGGTWELYFVCDALCLARYPIGYQIAYSGKFVVSGPYSVGNILMVQNTTPPPPGTCAAARTDTPTQSVYLPNITKTLGGPAGWVTPFIVQNTGTTSTTLEISFYKFSDGSCVARRTVSNLLPGTSFPDIPNNDSFLPDDTQFSVVVRSFGSAVVSTVNQVQGSGASFQALAYTGTSTGATTAYLPNVTRRFYGYDIPFIIQNLGASTATATSTFTSVASATCLTAHTYVKTLVVQSGRSGVVDPNFEPAFTGAANSGLADGCQYSVVVTSAQPLAVVANAHNETGAPQAYSHNALTGGAATLYAPYAALGGPGGRFSPIVVQNVGSTATGATIEFTPLGGGAVKSFTLASIAAGASRPFDPRYSNGDTAQPLCTGVATAACLGNGEYSARILSTGTMAAVALPVSSTTAAAYSAASVGMPKSYLPNITRTLGGALGWTTPIVLQSTTATTASVKWYRFSDGVLVTTQTVALTPNAAIRIDPRSVAGLSDDTQYAVVADGGISGNITAIVYEQNFSGGDGDMIYEGFPAP